MPAINESYRCSEQLRELGLKHCGENVSVHKNCELIGLGNISIGSNVRIDPWTIISAFGGEVTIGSYVHIGAYCYLAGGGGIVLDDFSGLSQGVKIYSVTDDYGGGGLTNPTVPKRYLNTVAKRVVLERHAIVGSGSVILPGVVIAHGASVGALSLVKKSLDAWGMYAGVPARRFKDRKRDIIEAFEAELRLEQAGAASGTALP